MDYKFWKGGTGRYPVADAIADLAQSDIVSVKALKRNFEMFERRSYETLCNSHTISKLKGKNPSKIHYYRIDLPKKIARIFFIIKGTTAIFLHIIIKKSDDIKIKERNIAEGRARVAILEE